MKIIDGRVRRCLLMANRKAKDKRETITFEPDDDVALALAEIQEALGKTRGLRTQYINDALRAELPNVIRRKIDALQKLAEAKKPHT